MSRIGQHDTKQKFEHSLFTMNPPNFESLDSENSCRDIVLSTFIRYRGCHFLQSNDTGKRKSPAQKVAYTIRDISEENSFDLTEVCWTSRLWCGHMSKMVKNQVFSICQPS